MDKSSVIFGNPIPKKTIKKANKSKRGYLKKYGDDQKADYKIGFENIDTLDFIGAKNIVFKKENEKLPDNALIVGKKWLITFFLSSMLPSGEMFL